MNECTLVSPATEIFIIICFALGIIGLYIWMYLDLTKNANADESVVEAGNGD